MSDIKNLELEIDELLKRGVGEFIDPDGSFKQKLLKKARGEYTKPIVIKFGVDPTRPDIHLGHAVVFRKLRKFQELGCKVIFLVGDYTAQIGDPTGKSKVRPEIDQAAVVENMKTYLDQIDSILLTDARVFSWIRNSDWFTAITDLTVNDPRLSITDNNDPQKHIEVDGNSFIGKAAVFESTRMQITDLKMRENVSVITMRNLLWTLRKITHSQLIERDMFQQRIKNNEELYMHEMMYPVLQGIDSSVLHAIYGSCDLEVGGTDQTFNMLMGRTVMKNNMPPQEPQAVLSFKLLEGLDGKEKMSKSLNNYIGITDEPSDMYGKVMSIPDTSVLNYFELCTFTPTDELEDIKKDLADKDLNPKILKMKLAKQIVAIYHGQLAADKAEENFNNTFKKGGIPENVESAEVEKGTMLVDVLLAEKIIASKTEWRRLLDEGAVTEMILDTQVSDPFQKIEQDGVYKIGKRRFLKIVVK